ncbi:radical SAM protein, partial [bacterium]
MTRTAVKAYSYLRRLVKREINYHLARPTDLLLFLTYRCTSRCKTCVMWQRKAIPDELTLSEYKKLIDTASENGIENVELFGGDALLRKEILIPLVTYIKKSGIPRIYLATNCNLLDEDTANSLVEAGIDVFFVSLDAIGELHDRVRGVPGTFDRVKRGMEYLIKAKKGRQCPKVIVNTTVSSLNIDEFEKIVPFALEMGADEVAFEYVGEFHPR